MNNAPEIVTNTERNLLQTILHRMLNEPEALEQKQFRVEFENDRGTIDKLCNTQLIKIDRTHSFYSLSFMGIYLVNSELSNKIFNDIDSICDVLRDHYKQYFGKPIQVSHIQKQLGLEKTYLGICLDVLCECVSMSRSTDLLDKDAEIYPIEGLLDFKNYSELPVQYLRSWFPSAFKSSAKPGNTESNASKREQILGAALVIIANFPEKCKRGDKIVGKKVFSLIEYKAKTWWPSEEPPLSADTATRLINKWLKTLE